MQRDLGVTAAVVDWLPEWSASIFAAVTTLGALPFVVAVLGWLYLRDLVEGVRRVRRPLCSDRTAFIVAAVFGGLALAVALKAAFSFPRPASPMAVVPADGFGFPSGHTLAATVLWGALALWTDRWTTRRRFAVAGAVVVLVAFSRVALGVHYAIDVVASVAFGVLYLLAVDRFCHRDPNRAFSVAIAVSIAAVLVTGGGEDAVLAITGTVGAFLGWRSVERIGPSVLDIGVPTGRLR